MFYNEAGRECAEKNAVYNEDNDSFGEDAETVQSLIISQCVLIVFYDGCTCLSLIISNISSSKAYKEMTTPDDPESVKEG